MTKWNVPLSECNQPEKDAEYYALRFANYCGEMEIYEPTHSHWVKFMNQGAGYYDKHVENAENKYKQENKKL